MFISRWFVFSLTLAGCLVQSVSAADVEIVARQVAVKDYCAWPNITKLPDGKLAAIVFNQPSHGRLEGEVECWTSPDGRAWAKAGVPEMHDPLTNRMNVACGLNGRGELVVLCSGWMLSAEADEKGRRTLGDTRRAYCGISSDGGRTWRTRRDALPPHPPGATDYIPFGDIVRADDGSLRAPGYVRYNSPKSYEVWMFRSDDDGGTWKQHAPLAKDHGETALMHVGNGRWLAASRRQLDGTPTDLFRSDDDGKTWSLAIDKIGEASQHPADLLRLADGRILLSLGLRQPGRRGFGVRISADDGATWGPLLAVVDDCPSGDCGYPSSVQMPDGNIVTGYYADGTPQYTGYQFSTVEWKLPAK